MRGLPLLSLVTSLLSAVAIGCSGGVAGIPGESSSGGSSGSSGVIGVPPETPPSASWNGPASGCGDVFAFRASSDGDQFVTVQIDRDRLGMKLGDKRTFDLATREAGVSVSVEIFARAPKEAKYCSDVVSERIASTVWPAEGGKLVVELGKSDGGGSGANETYRATVRIEGLRVVGPDRGTAVVIPSIEIKDVLVGWLAG